MAKRSGWIKFNFDESLLNQSNKKQSTASTKTKNTISSKDENAQLLNQLSQKPRFNFMKEIEPKLVNQLAVHPKKITEVESWLDQNVLGLGPIGRNKSRPSILLITGPSGCGKTATLHVLCKQRSIGISEWINPVTEAYNAEEYDSSNYSGGQVSNFTEFLIESSYGSLLTGKRKNVGLVKDLPNIFLSKPEEFSQVLEQLSLASNVTAIFIVTEVASSALNIEKNLFPDHVKSTYNVDTISFNSCANTMLKTALQRAQRLMKEHLDIFKLPSDDLIEGLVSSSMGDIRCAINQLYLSSLQGTNSIELDVKKNFITNGRKRKKPTKTVTLKSRPRDEALGLFHSVGRVLNPKVDPETNRIQCNFSSFVDELSTQPSTFLGFLFENYPRYFGDLDEAMIAADLLSTSQTFMEQWSERQEMFVLGLWISVMGLMMHNKHRVSKWNPIKGPVKINLANKGLVFDKASGGYISPLDGCCYNTITRSNKFHKFSFV